MCVYKNISGTLVSLSSGRYKAGLAGAATIGVASPAPSTTTTTVVGRWGQQILVL